MGDLWIGNRESEPPGFIVLVSGGNQPDGGKTIVGVWISASVYQGVQCRSHGEPVLYLEKSPDVSRPLRRRMLDAVDEINRQTYAEFGNPETVTADRAIRDGVPHANGRDGRYGYSQRVRCRACCLRRESGRSQFRQTIAWWRGAWRNVVCASFSSTTGAGTITELRPKIP